MSVETVPHVSYAMIMRVERSRVLQTKRWNYRLIRTEGGLTEELVSGYGPKVRIAIGAYLQDVRALGGPDSAAAAAAIQASWMTEVSP